MNNTCPCCGQLLPEKGPLVINTRHRTLSRSGVMMRSPGRVVALAKLLRDKPRTASGISRDLLGKTVHLDKGDEVPSLVFVYVSQLRRALVPLYATVELRGAHYHLVEHYYHLVEKH